MRCSYLSKTLDGGERISVLQVAPQGRGEEYLVCCPFCSDTRSRLSINHRWGLRDLTTGTNNLWLATCYNEGCLKEYGNQRELFSQLYDFMPFSSTSVTSPDKPVVINRKFSRGAKLPSGLWPLEDMCVRNPRHPAITYLLNRLIEPHYVGKVYSAMYCVDSTDMNVNGRLVVPIIKDGALVSWQARLLRPPISKKEPKWWTAPGSPVSRTLYNCDVALKYNTIVLVEGITDVWGFGRQACGVFKKAISEPQVKLLVERASPTATVVIMFDPDQDKAEAEKGREHHIEAARQILAETPLRERLLPVYLPSGTDPGELDRAFMRDLIRAEARRAKLPVNFGVP